MNYMKSEKIVSILPTAIAERQKTKLRVKVVKQEAHSHFYFFREVWWIPEIWIKQTLIDVLGDE